MDNMEMVAEALVVIQRNVERLSEDTLRKLDELILIDIQRRAVRRAWTSSLDGPSIKEMMEDHHD